MYYVIYAPNPGGCSFNKLTKVELLLIINEDLIRITQANPQICKDLKANKRFVTLCHTLYPGLQLSSQATVSSVHCIKQG